MTNTEQNTNIPVSDLVWGIIGMILTVAALIAFFWFSHCYQVAFDIEMEKHHEQDVINENDPYLHDMYF